MQQTKYDVFISYSRKDYVDDAGNVLEDNMLSKIKDTLKANGISYWFDEEGIYSGDEFASVLTNAIRNSRIFLFISSVNSNQSKWTSNEISTALEFQKTIIPFRIDKSPYNDSVMMKIVSFDYIECKDEKKAMSKLLRAVKHFLPSSICQKRKSVIDVPDGAKGATVIFDVDGKRTEKVFSYDDGGIRILHEKETGSDHRSDHDSTKVDGFKSLKSRKAKVEAKRKVEKTPQESTFSNESREQIVKEFDKICEIKNEPTKSTITYKIIKHLWPLGLSILVFFGVICYGFYDEQIWKYKKYSDIIFSLFCWCLVGFIISGSFYYLAEILRVWLKDMSGKKGSISFAILLVVLMTIGLVAYKC